MALKPTPKCKANATCDCNRCQGAFKSGYFNSTAKYKRWKAIPHNADCKCTFDDYDGCLVPHSDCERHGDRQRDYPGRQFDFVQCKCGKVSWPKGATRSSGAIPDGHSLTGCGGDRRMMQGAPSQRPGSSGHVGQHYENEYCSANPACTPILQVSSEEIRREAYRPPPDHYSTDAGIDPWAVWDAFDLDRYTANATKYLLRAGKKDGESRLKDLNKARDYVLKAIEIEENRNA